MALHVLKTIMENNSALKLSWNAIVPLIDLHITPRLHAQANGTVIGTRIISLYCHLRILSPRGYSKYVVKYDKYG